MLQVGQGAAIAQAEYGQQLVVNVSQALLLEALSNRHEQLVIGTAQQKTKPVVFEARAVALKHAVLLEQQTVATAVEDKRRLVEAVEGHHFTNENDVIAALIAVGSPALKTGRTAFEQRYLTRTTLQG
ncbi:hypothetical protein D3C84_949700 [compost metagenome]